jgi:hypothetical protein
MTRRPIFTVAVLALSLASSTCVPAADPFATCIEGRWTLAPEQPDDASASLGWLPRSMVVYEIRRSAIVVRTTTGELVEEQRVTVAAEDRTRGQIDLDSGERLDAMLDDACTVLTLGRGGERFVLQRVAG